MASTFLNISTDTTLGGNGASDTIVSSQKAIKSYADTKQDALVSGTNIKTINNQSLLGSGNISISGGGSTSVDGETITYNNDDELQATALINSNDGSPLTIWEGSEEDYNTSTIIEKTWYYWGNSGSGAPTATASSLPSSRSWRTPAYGDGVFVVTSSDTRYGVRSTDGGKTWSEIQLPDSGYNSATFINGNFVVVNYGSSSNKAAYSSDGGITWTATTLPANSYYWNPPEAGNNILISTQSSSSTVAARSTDGGQTWSSISMPSATYWKNVAYGTGNNFVVLSQNSNKAAYSTNGGQTWLSSTLPTSMTWTKPAYGNGRFVTIGSYDDEYAEEATVAYSTNNGQTWSNAYFEGWGTFSQIEYGNNVFVTISSYGEVYYSSDGVSWEYTTLPTTNKNWTLAPFGNGLFLALPKTSYNYAAYSTDGINWYAISLPSSKNWGCCGYGGNNFIALSGDSATYITNASSCYTIVNPPETSSTVYDDINVTSAKTITSVGTNSITLSDSKVYTYNSSNNIIDYKTIGTAHPDWLCNVEGVGVKIRDTLIANVGDQVNNATLTIKTNGTTAGTFSANASADVTIDLPIVSTTTSVTSGSTDALTSGGAYTNLVRRRSTSSATGSATQGVYINSSGQVTACTAVTSSYSASGTAPVNGTAVASAVSGKQNTLVSGTNIKTVNGTSLLGSGDLTIDSVINPNTNSNLTIWEGSESDWNTSDVVDKTWYSWIPGGAPNVAFSTLPEKKYWREAAYGNGVFISNASSITYCVRSEDGGETWSNVNLPSGPSSYSNVVYGDGTFVTLGQVSNSTAAAYSSDGGLTWTSVTLPVGGFWNEPIFANGVFMSLSGTKCVRSTDAGRTWSNVTLPSGSWGGYIAHGDGNNFVVVSSGSSSSAIYTNNNGASWSSSSLPAYLQWVTPAYGNGRFVTVGYSDDEYAEEPSYVAYSTNGGQTWTESEEFYELYTYDKFSSVIYGNGKFLMFPNGGHIVYYSTNGESWSTANIVSSGSYYWKCTYDGGMFFAVANNIAAYSTDGVNWTSINLSTSGTWSTPTYANGRFVSLAFNSTSGLYTYLSNTNTYFTTVNPPTTSSIVYDDINSVSSYTISSVATNKITLSDGNTYNYNQSGNVLEYKNVGAAHPDWLCNIEGIGVKKGDTIIANVGGADVDVDNETISYDSNEDLQTIAVKNKRDGSTLPIWQGTESQWTNGEQTTWYCWEVNSENKVYTLDSTPTTSSVVYSTPETSSALTISEVGSGSITLSDNNIYTYTSSDNIEGYRTVGNAHPDYLCFINGVGIRIGNTDITPPITTVLSSLSTNTQVPSAKAVYDEIGEVESALNTINSGE